MPQVIHTIFTLDAYNSIKRADCKNIYVVVISHNQNNFYKTQEFCKKNRAYKLIMYPINLLVHFCYPLLNFGLL